MGCFIGLYIVGDNVLAVSRGISLSTLASIFFSRLASFLNFELQPGLVSVVGVDACVWSTIGRGFRCHKRNESGFSVFVLACVVNLSDKQGVLSFLLQHSNFFGRSSISVGNGGSHSATPEDLCRIMYGSLKTSFSFFFAALCYCSRILQYLC